MPEESATQLEEDRVRHNAAVAAIAAIEKAQYDMLRKATDADIYTNAAAHVISLYQHRLDGDSRSGGDATQLSKIDQAERELRLAGLQAERAEVFNLTRRSKISDALARKLVREIDLMESRFR